MSRKPPLLTGALELDLRGTVGGFPLRVALTAPAGRVTAVFGPSGSGKTSLLRAAAGLTRLSGFVRAGGAVWQDDTAGVFEAVHRRNIGFVFQDAALFPHLTVRENLRYAERRNDLAPDAAGPLSFDRVVEELGLSRHLARSPEGLSGGETQRVALARALLTGPSVLFLDEPLSALHLGARAAILRTLRQLAPEIGFAALHVTHDPGEVAAVADRIVLLAEGRVQAAGPAERIYERLDAGDRTARFEAGSLLVARMATPPDAGGIAEVDLGGERLRIPAPAGPPPGVGREVRVRVMARDVALARQRPEAVSIRNILAGEVVSVTPDRKPPDCEVVVAVAGSRLRARITDEAAQELELRPGLPIFAMLKSIAVEDP